MQINGLIKTNLSNRVTDILRKRILEGRYKNRYHLSEGKLAEEFGVSRGPVRDAIKMLENEGFVYTPPNGRTVVIQFNQQDIEDYYKLRIHFEGEAIKKIINNSTMDEDYLSWLNELEGYLIKMEKHLQKNNEKTAYDFDYAFHESIIKKSNNNIVIRIWNSLAGTRKSIMEINENYLSKYDILSPKKIYSYHQGIFEGIKKRDAQISTVSLKGHLDWGINTYKLVIQKVTDIDFKKL